MSSQITCVNRCIVTPAAFVWVFSSVCFQMSRQNASRKECVWSHCICAIFLQNEFSNVTSNQPTQQMHSRIGCTCKIFLLVEYLSVSSNELPEQMHSRIDCNCTVCVQTEFSNVSSNGLHQKLHSHIHCICMAFLQSEFLNVSSMQMPKQRQSGGNVYDGQRFEIGLKYHIKVSY